MGDRTRSDLPQAFMGPQGAGQVTPGPRWAEGRYRLICSPTLGLTQSPRAAGPTVTAAAVPTAPRCPPTAVTPDHPAGRLGPETAPAVLLISLVGCFVCLSFVGGVRCCRLSIQALGTGLMDRSVNPWGDVYQGRVSAYLEEELPEAPHILNRKLRQ